MKQVSIPWDLRGMLLLNLTSALCTSPTMHLGMKLAQRVECAMAGYVLIDLWRITANKLAVKRGVAKGTCFMAEQTCCHLQRVALGVILVALGKDKVGNPWQGHCRLGEIGVEEFFGKIRCQNASAQHTARSFWKASAREMLARHPKGSMPPADIVQPLSAEQFEAASKRAYRSALSLVAFCSQVTEESLREHYEFLCDGKHFAGRNAGDPLHPFEDDLEEDLQEREAALDVEETVASKDVAVAQVRQIQEEAVLDQSELPDVDKLSSAAAAADLADVPDRKELEELLQGDDVQDDAVGQGDPETLLEALRGLSSHTSKAALFDSLWKLVMFLRHWRLWIQLTQVWCILFL